MDKTLLFVHTHKFKLIDKAYYSTGGLNDTALNRYAVLAKNLVVAARVEELNTSETKKLSLITIPNVRIYNVAGYGPKMVTNLWRITKSSDFLIIRLPSIYGVLALFYAKILRKPYLVEVVGDIFGALYNHSFSGKLLAGPLWLVHRMAIYYSPFVSYITEAYLQQEYPTKGEVGAALSNITIKPLSPEILLNRYSKIENTKENDAFKIGLIGALNIAYKGHRVAINALKQLVDEGYTNIELEFVGAGDKSALLDYSKNLNVEDKVKFCGTLPSGAKIFEWIDSLDVYIQPSSTEAHGRAVVEAMSRACPVLVSNIGGLRESVKSEYRFEDKDFKKLAEQLKEFIGSKQKLKEASEKSFEGVKKYDEELIENNRRAFFNKFMNRYNLAK